MFPFLPSYNHSILYKPSPQLVRLHIYFIQLSARKKCDSVHLGLGVQEEVAAEFDRLESRLHVLDESLSSSGADPETQLLLQATAGLWQPIITASASERLQNQNQNQNHNSERISALGEHGATVENECTEGGRPKGGAASL